MVRGFRAIEVQTLSCVKISMTCISSISALKEYKELQTELPKYLVIVQMDRVISNAIACDLQVKHESPQLIILQGGKGIWQATHYKIKHSFGKRYRTICKKILHNRLWGIFM